MAEKAPMIGIVVSPSLHRRLKEWQERERRKSFSEFCALLIEYAERRLKDVGSLTTLLQSVGLGSESSHSGRDLIDRQVQIAKEAYEQHAHPSAKKIKSHRAKAS